MAQSAADRRRAQRETARRVRANRELRPAQRTHVIPVQVRSSVWNNRVNYANDVMSGREPMPAPGSLEARNLASMASYAAWGRADPRYEAAFSRYWYHLKKQAAADEAEEIVVDEYDDEDTDESEPEE